jgi:hypothetical protein
LLPIALESENKLFRRVLVIKKVEAFIARIKEVVNLC